MKVLIIGVGGVGGFLGSYLEETDFDITYVARGERFNYLKNRGLVVHTKLGERRIRNIKVRHSIPENDRYDFIISTVKLYDFDNLISELKTVGLKEAILLPFQNGIYAEQKISSEFEKVQAHGAVAQISSFIDDDQIIRHVGELATFFVGKMNEKNDSKLIDFCQKSQNVGLDIRLKQNIKEKIWDKFIFLSAYSGITTLTQKTIGEIFETQNLRKKFVEAMNETYNLSKSFGVIFKSNPVKYWIKKIEKMPSHMTSSMFIDYKKNKKLELNWLSGSIIRYSQRFGNACPIHKEIVDGIISR